MRRLQKLLLALVMLLASAPAAATTPLALYKFNEGTGTTIGDSAASPVAATITAGGSSAWGSNSGGGYYNFAGAATATSAALNGTKFQTAYGGTTKLYFECEFDDTTPASFDIIAEVGNVNIAYVFLVFVSGTGTALEVYSSNGNYSFPWAAGRNRLQVAVDTGQAAASRIKAWRNGSALTATVSSELTSASAVDSTSSTWSSNALLFSNYATLTLPSYISYAAFYDPSNPLGSTEATSHNSAILANNDADPNGGGTTNYDAFMFALGWSTPPCVLAGLHPPGPVEVIDMSVPGWWQARHGVGLVVGCAL